MNFSEPTTPGTELPPAPPPEKTSVWEDFVDIFFSPAQVFRRRRVNGNFWIPLLVVTIISGIGAYANRGIMQPIVDAEFQRQAAATMQANPQITPEIMERSRAVAQTMATIGPVIGVPILIVVSAFFAWLLAKFFDASVTWGAALVVAAYATVPRILQVILVSVQGLLMDPSQMTSRFAIELSPARFFPTDSISPLVSTLLERFELFTLWGIVLITIGIVVCGNLSKKKAWLFALVFWILGSLPAMLGAMRMAGTAAG